ncbi:hypothetical protein [[Acholeplasma] multilocale]|uniref:hypothetical protein n=1 Tax=[Acholeplasma] multilocale TaxID=264638 RepID=UPI00047B8307|nr:hypothetical protein [[Acholeplasma] multilocale]
MKLNIKKDFLHIGFVGILILLFGGLIGYSSYEFKVSDNTAWMIPVMLSIVVIVVLSWKMYSLIKKTYQNTFVKKENKLRVLTSLLKSTLKTPETYIFMFVIPVILSLILYFFASNMGRDGIRPAIMSIIPFTPGLGAMLLVNFLMGEWKSSIFLKRIKMSGISKKTFIIQLWATIVIVSLLFFPFVFSTLFITDAIDPNDSTINFVKSIVEEGNFYTLLGWLLSYSMFVTLSILISLLISGAVNKRAHSEALIAIYILLVIFLSDMFFDPLQFQDNMVYMAFGYLMPHKYIIWSSFMFAANVHISPDNVELIIPSIDSMFLFNEIWQPMLFSLIIIGGFAPLTYLSFKYDSK